MLDSILSSPIIGSSILDTVNILVSIRLPSVTLNEISVDEPISKEFTLAKVNSLFNSENVGTTSVLLDVKL